MLHDCIVAVSNRRRRVRADRSYRRIAVFYRGHSAGAPSRHTSAQLVNVNAVVLCVIDSDRDTLLPLLQTTHTIHTINR